MAEQFNPEAIQNLANLQSAGQETATEETKAVDTTATTEAATETKEEVIETPLEETKAESKEVEPKTEAQETEEKEEVNENESSLIIEDDTEAGEVTESATESEKEVSTETLSLNDQIAKHTDGQYNTIDELLEKASEQSQPGELKFANDQIAKLNDYVAKGGDLNELLQFQSMGISSKDPNTVEGAKELIKQEMKLNEPGMDSDEIDYEFDKKFNLDSEDHETDRDFEMVKKRLYREAKKSQDALKSREDEAMKLLEKPADNSAELTKAQELEQEKTQKNWEGSVSKALEGYNTLEVKLGEKAKFNYKVDNVDGVKNTMNRPDQFLNRYINEDGSPNMEKFRKEITILENFEKITSTLYTQARAAGAKDQVKNIDNITTATSSKGRPSTDVKSAEAQVAEQMRANGTLR